MTKNACMSNCKYPENHSKKKCVCGGHSGKAKKPRDKKPSHIRIREIQL